ncbi:MAG: malate synthase A [Proteobacteria bacterium]|nr:malate synthase A [Pseudomonadota bacterium]MCP4919075.1 malate synthase A [Pseudomonadota bacterium]
MALLPEHDVQLVGPELPEVERVLTDEAVAFLVALTLKFRPRIAALLEARQARQAQFDEGARPGFLAETWEIRNSNWKVAPVPADLMDRKVEITGPVDRKMVINALNSGARVFMADFEDSNAPTWKNVIEGQVNLADAVRRDITFERPGKTYSLNDDTAVLMVRPRGLHLSEAHVTVTGLPIPASLFDFGLFFFHNARELLARGSGPYFYLPKLEHHLEARLWNDVFVFAQEALGVPLGSIKATVLIETLPAAFQMDEILYALRQHSAGLNCGRWDYIFSLIKTLRMHRDFVLPDRAQVGMNQPCMRAYSALAVRTCHRRGVHAMGGMAAQIPLKHDPEANERALGKVRVDKEREAADGHDGTWVAHPGLVQLALDAMDFEGPHQIHRPGPSVPTVRMLEVPHGTRTLAGVRLNLSVGSRYLAAWLAGQGCVPIDGLMEDAATAEISRTQLWQWRRHSARLDDGTLVSEALLRAETDALLTAHPELSEAAELLLELVLADDLADFLTLPAYARITTTS